MRLSGTISQMGLLELDPQADFDPASLRRARVGVLLGLLFLAGPLADLARGSYGNAELAAFALGLGE